MIRRNTGLLLWATAMAVMAMPIVGTGSMSVKIVRPLSGAKVKGIVRVLAQVSGAVPKFVVFGVDKEWPHSTNVLPYSFDLDTKRLSDGAHTLLARAIDGVGAEAMSQGVRVVVANKSVSPSVVVASNNQTTAAGRPGPGPLGVRGFAPGRRVVTSTRVPASNNLGAAAEPGLVPARDMRREVISSAQEGVKPQLAPAAAAPLAPQAPPVLIAPSERESESPKLSPRGPADDAAPKPIAGQSAQPSGRQGGAAIEPVAHGRSRHLVLALRRVRLPGSPKGSTHYLSFRQGVEKCGGLVNWIHLEKQAEGSVRGKNIKVRIGSSQARVNQRLFELKFPARLVDNRTFVPVSFCSIALPVRRVSYRGDRLEIVIAWGQPTQVALVPLR